jgi:hypothetical protein
MNKGFFVISDYVYTECWDDVKIIFNYFRPTYIEFRHWENDKWYFYGESNQFDKVVEGDKIPEYTIEILKDGRTNLNRVK